MKPSYQTMSEFLNYSEIGIYHIHVDAIELPEEFRTFLKESVGFVEDNFIEVPQEGYASFVPNYTLSKKIPTKEEFDDNWIQVTQKGMETGLKGYIEGEFIKNFDYLSYKKYTGQKPSFHIKRRQLRGPPNEIFRQSEIHLVMNADQSDSQLITDLLNTGMYAGYFIENGKKGIVLTMQGYTTEIVPLYLFIKKFIGDTGGAANCILTMELTVRSQLFRVIPTQLPEIADRVSYTA